MESLCVVDPAKMEPSTFKKHLADCVVLTHDNKLLLQQRPADWGRFGGCLNIFGGHVENGETVMQALQRELNEELGAQVSATDVVFIGALTEDFTGHTELVHIHFWHDRHGTITGCYEGKAIYYDCTADAMTHPKIMDYARWALYECQKKNLIK